MDSLKKITNPNKEDIATTLLDRLKNITSIHEDIATRSICYGFFLIIPTKKRCNVPILIPDGPTT
jgi:hypothetical protein